MFWLFLVLRGFIAVGQAGFDIVAPTIIGDMFSGVARSRALSLFYMILPCGRFAGAVEPVGFSGFGYVEASTVANHAGSWKWGIRATTIPCLLCLLCVVLFVRVRPFQLFNTSD